VTAARPSASHDEEVACYRRRHRRGGRIPGRGRASTVHFTGADYLTIGASGKPDNYPIRGTPVTMQFFGHKWVEAGNVHDGYTGTKDDFDTTYTSDWFDIGSRWWW
jgi:hypothetical protein